MTQEERRLLLTDLCTRLPYGVKVQDDMGRIDDLTIGNCDLIDLYYNEDDVYTIFPLLRPMSSMTEEEKEYIKNRWCCEDWDDIYDFFNHYKIDAGDTYAFIDWLNAHHFDYRGLIGKGLALEAPEGMYNS